MDLLERHDELAVLDEAVTEARDGRGTLVLVTGEAGIGKSSIIEAWLAALTEAHVHVGWCDDLVTGRALGPLRDIARSARGAVAEAVAAQDVGSLLDAVLDLLDDPLRPTVLVLEDLHWADEATLDVLRYVGRRVGGLSGLVVGTYRDDEVGPDHPLSGVLGALGAAPVRRLQLRPLSATAVEQLAQGRDVDAVALHATTGGNPFFVSETLRSPRGEVPTTVVDAVLVQLRALSEDTRRAVERLAVVPGRIDAPVIDTATDGDPTLLAPAERRGLLVAGDGGGLRFRHELSRRAVLDAMTTVDRQEAHRRMLDQLRAAGVDDHALLLHHAVGADAYEEVVHHGTHAADEAFGVGAYRAAAAALDHVLRQAQLLEPQEHSRLLRQAAWAAHNLHRFADAVTRAELALRRARTAGDALGETRALRILARARYVAAESEGALAAAEEAVAVAEGIDDPEARAEAATVRLSMWSLLDHAGAAAQDCPRVLEAVRAVGRTDLESLVLNYGAVAQIITGGDRDEALAMLQRAIEVARDGRHHEEAARAYTNIVGAMLLWRDHDGAMRWLDEGLDHTADHDVSYFRFTMLAHRGTRLLDLGRFDEAEADLRALLADTTDAGVLANTASRGLARIALRRGDSDADDLLAEAVAHAERSEAMQYIAPVAVLRVEREFLVGTSSSAAESAATVLGMEGAGAWAHGEALAWCQRAGAALPDGWEAETVHEEWDHVLHGRWQQALALAEADGRAYDAAMARIDSGDVDEMLTALQALDDLGAVAAARLTRRRLRAAGLRSVPRGPRRSTRADPGGLTRRQLEVLDLLGDGLTNTEIADQLVLSVRTVDHHVSAILQRLGVTSRHEAVAAHAALAADQADA